MKKILSMLLAVLSLTLCLPALAEEAAYPTTQSFLRVMDQLELIYTNYGIDEDEDEHILMGFQADDMEYDMNLFFSKDLEQTTIIVWYLISFEAKDTIRVMDVCNTLNANYRYTRFVVDTSDNTVTCAMDLLYRDKNVGLTVMDGMGYMMDILEVAYPSLEPYHTYAD